MGARTGRYAAALLLAGVARAAQAAGGADIIDDSEVEQAGICHLEMWGTSLTRGGGILNIGPACTPRRLPWLEIDGFLNRYVPARGERANTIGLGPKVALRPAASGLGVGLSGSLSLDTRDGHPAYAAANLPVTLPLGVGWTLNANAGVQWTRGVHVPGFAGGAQIVWQPPHGPEIMLEGFRAGTGPFGQQAHLRWTVDRGRIDIDLMGGRYTDGVSSRSVTLGLTIRR